MAPPAGDIARGIWPRPGEVFRLLAPTPGRAEITTRIAVICALTALVTSIVTTPWAAISAYVVFFMIRPDRVTSIVLSIAMLLLVTVVLGLIIVIAIFCMDDPLWRVVWMVVLSVSLLFLTSASKLRPVGAILAMIVGYGLDELGIAPVGELATRALLYAWLMVAIPVGVVIVVNLVMGPSPRKLACQALARRLRLAAQHLGQAGANRTALTACLREGSQQIATWLRLSKVEGSTSSADLAALQQAVASTTAILMAVDLAASEPKARLPVSVATPVIEALQAMAGMLEQGGYPVDIELTLPAGVTLPPLANAVAAELQSAIAHFAVVEGKPAQAEAPPPKARGGFFLPDARTNPAHLRYALKTTAAAMFCYLLYMQLDWSGIHTCFITCYVVSLSSAAETVEKLTLRIAGCLVGAALGIATLVWVLPAMTSITELMALMFVGMWLSAWVAQGSPRIAYAGFQIAFAFLLCVLQGAAPAFDLTIARDRIIGILLGNVVVYLMFTRVWPVSIAGQADVALAALLRQWEAVTRAVRTGQRRTLAAQAMAQQGALEANVALLRYEPAWVRPVPEWIAQRRRALTELEALEGPLFLIAERAPGDAAVQTRLRSAAERAGVSGLATDSGSIATPDTMRDALLALVDERLARIAREVPDAVSKESLTHAPA
ncbi:fusaric acid resistance protein [Ralstonia sp. A12]|uniref:FUSC family protein n=1 Tax=Ralstonia sp. A12 TaxID=1217052 RepID=UPI000574DCBD|nr:FUSC family protein [Ralstonia sp. A12]KHK49647.1 fusaric acid resistance protein [Ralstonia sp. A12]